MKFSISSLYNLFDWVKEGKFDVDKGRLIIIMSESKAIMIKEFIAQIALPTQFYNALCHFGIDEVYVRNYIYTMNVSETDKSILHTVATLCHYSEAIKIGDYDVSFKIEDVRLLKLLEDFCTVVVYAYSPHNVYKLGDNSLFRYNFVTKVEKTLEKYGYKEG